MFTYIFRNKKDSCPTVQSCYIWAWCSSKNPQSERRYPGMSELRPESAKSATRFLSLAHPTQERIHPVKYASRFCSFSQNICGSTKCCGYLEACGASS